MQPVQTSRIYTEMEGSLNSDTRCFTLTITYHACCSLGCVNEMQDAFTTLPNGR